MSAGLSFRNVHRSFPTRRGVTQALAGVDLEIEPGSFTAIVGPSGCGKSTLLHIAAGLDTQYEGSFARHPSNATGACLFQSPRLLPWLTALRNVAFVLEAHGWSRSRARRRAAEMLDLVGLRAAAHQFPAQLSGGMQQRVALARALVIDPAILLMDEPFAALDELTARRLRAELVDLHQASRRTTVFVTHHIHEACYLADRVVVMSAHPGRIIAQVDISVERPRAYEDPRLVEYAATVLGHIDSGSHASAR